MYLSLFNKERKRNYSRTPQKETLNTHKIGTGHLRSDSKELKKKRYTPLPLKRGGWEGIKIHN